MALRANTVNVISLVERGTVKTVPYNGERGFGREKTRFFVSVGNGLDRSEPPFSP